MVDHAGRLDATSEVDSKRLQPGDRITLGFDGSRFHDATALVGCRIEDGLLELLGLWEAPRGERRSGRCPAGEVDARLDEVMDEYAVVRGYFDPPLWQSEIDAWAHEFGDDDGDALLDEPLPDDGRGGTVPHRPGRRAWSRTSSTTT